VGREKQGASERERKAKNCGGATAFLDLDLDLWIYPRVK